MADLEVEKEYQQLRTSIADETKKANGLEQENLELQKENELLLSRNKVLHEQRVALFMGLKPLWTAMMKIKVFTLKLIL